MVDYVAEQLGLSPAVFAGYSFALPAEVQGGQLRSTSKPEIATTL